MLFGMKLRGGRGDDSEKQAVMAKTQNWPDGWLKESGVLEPWYALAMDMPVKKGSQTAQDLDEVEHTGLYENDAARTDGAFIDALAFCDAMDKLLSVFEVLSLPKVCNVDISKNIL